MNAEARFDYARAFGRNLGLVSEAEQERVRQARAAIPGLGGVGGGHATTLARMGLGAFHLADPETFEMANFNRQAGARMGTVGRSKAEVIAGEVAAVNPEAEARVFPDGLLPGNLDAFLEGVNVVLDGLEFFAVETRRMLYAACRAKRIPVVHAGPVGYGAALVVFLPAGPSFDEFFGMDDGMTRAELLAAHLLGHGASAGADVDPARVDLERRTGPSLASACGLASALAATEALKLIVGRGAVAAAPHGLYYDPFRGRTRRLRGCPSLTRSWRGRMLRKLAFARVPALRDLDALERGRRESVERGAPLSGRGAASSAG